MTKETLIQTPPEASKSSETAKAPSAVKSTKTLQQTSSPTAEASKSIALPAYQCAVERLIVCGSGLAAYSATVVACSMNVAPLLITGPTPGGVLAFPGYIESWPGAAPNLQSHELAAALYSQAARLGTKFLFDSVQSIDTTTQPYTITTKHGKLLSASAIIVATGLTPKTLNLPGEASLLGRSVFTSAAFVSIFPRYAAVVGNNNTAAAEALALSTKVRRVTFVCNASQLSCAPSLAVKLRETLNIIIKYNVTVSNYNTNASGKLLGLTLVHPIGWILIDAFLVVLALGSEPKIDLLPPEAKTTNGFAKEYFDTPNLKGIFAAGSILESTANQPIMISASGFTAANTAVQYITSLKSQLAVAHFEFERTVQHESAKVATALILHGAERFSKKALSAPFQVTKTPIYPSEAPPAGQINPTTPPLEGKRAAQTPNEAPITARRPSPKNRKTSKLTKR
ncbi:MAG: NAD(P)/FAD-dependent oxidoreductase [Candidatus Hodgkinia cicadicola]